MRELVRMAEEAFLCDSLVDYQEDEINKGLKALASSDSLLRIRTEELRVTHLVVDDQRAMYNGQLRLTNIAEKDARKWFWIAVIAIGLAVYQAFGP